MTSIDLEGIEAVCFDAFGTLVEVSDRRSPYRHLLAAVTDRPARRNLKHRLMRQPLEGPEIETLVSTEALEKFERDLTAELTSIRLRPGIAALWRDLRDRGLKIAICSNLAAPYGPALRQVLPDRPDAEVFSYEVGLVKPEPEIYRAVVNRLACAPGKILFTGDTKKADIVGPSQAGMRAVPIADFLARR